MPNGLATVTRRVTGVMPVDSFGRTIRFLTNNLSALQRQTLQAVNDGTYDRSAYGLNIATLRRLSEMGLITQSDGPYSADITTVGMTVCADIDRLLART